MGMNGAGGAAKGLSPGGPHRGGEEGRRWRCVEQACDSDGEPAVASARPPRPPSGPQHQWAEGCWNSAACWGKGRGRSRRQDWSSGMASQEGIAALREGQAMPSIRRVSEREGHSKAGAGSHGPTRNKDSVA